MGRTEYVKQIVLTVNWASNPVITHSLTHSCTHSRLHGDNLWLKKRNLVNMHTPGWPPTYLVFCIQV